MSQLVIQIYFCSLSDKMRNIYDNIDSSGGENLKGELLFRNCAAFLFTEYLSHMQKCATDTPLVSCSSGKQDFKLMLTGCNSAGNFEANNFQEAIKNFAIFPFSTYIFLKKKAFN